MFATSCGSGVASGLELRTGGGELGGCVAQPAIKSSPVSSSDSERLFGLGKFMGDPLLVGCVLALGAGNLLLVGGDEDSAVAFGGGAGGLLLGELLGRGGGLEAQRDIPGKRRSEGGAEREDDGGLEVNHDSPFRHVDVSASRRLARPLRKV